MANEAVACGGTSGGGGDEVGTPSAVSSPNNRMKFLCSYGGKILPRHPDGQLKYIGGETRVIGVPRDISFSDLMKKLSSEFEGDMALKYQLIHEDLDVLVSVRTDEDLKHMLDEYDRHESEGPAKLRAFLFPSTPIALENQNALADPHAVEQRYIDAINNTVRTVPSFGPPPIIANSPTLSISTCSSPKGNSPNTVDAMHRETFKNSYHNSRLPMPKVQSSPSLYSLNAPAHQSNNLGNTHFYQHHHHHYQHHPPGSRSSRPLLEPHRLTPSSSFVQPNFGRAPISHLNQYYPNVQSVGSSNIHNWHSSGYNMGSGNSSKYGYYDEHFPYGCRTFERLDSLPPSPRNKILE